MKDKMVYVVGYDGLIEDLFNAEPSYKVTNFLQQADLVVFTGGADVSPQLYGEEAIKQTSSDPQRDSFEAGIYNRAPKTALKVGICRGGQFLNVLSGGKMYQHVTNHTQTHDLTDLLTGDTVQVTSTHHQMMIPGPDAEVLAAVLDHRSTVYCHANDPTGQDPESAPEFESEVIWYKDKASLCFQPHPEYGHTPTRKYFFNLINMIEEMRNPAKN